MYSAESKKRRPRFSNAELATLVNEVYRNREVLFSKKCSTYSNEQKSRAWQGVTDSINAVCLVEPRTPEEVRRKWYYYLSDKKKETARHRAAAQKKTSTTSPSILYSPTDLKILEILGEIDSGGGGYENGEGDGVEGLICEVDAEALQPLRSPSSSSVNGEHGQVDEHKFLNPGLTYEELGAVVPHQHHHHVEAAINGFAASLSLAQSKNDSVAMTYDNSDCYPNPYGNRQPSPQKHYNNKRRPRDDHTDHNAEYDSNSTTTTTSPGGGREQQQMEKKRLTLQECQLQVLQNIYKQMQEDSERNRVFQEAFLDLQRQRLALKRASTSAPPPPPTHHPPPHSHPHVPRYHHK